jgi:hypothetical protein
LTTSLKVRPVQPLSDTWWAHTCFLVKNLGESLSRLEEGTQSLDQYTNRLEDRTNVILSEVFPFLDLLCAQKLISS